MKSIRDNPILNQDILSDVAKLEEKIRVELVGIR
jgi:chloramphenicol 3-O-phosphotransferase